MITTTLSILSLLAVASAIVFLFRLAKVLDTKFDALQTAFNDQIKTLDDQVKVVYEREDKNEERIATIVKWCETLRENQDTLQTDLERVYYGVKKEVRVQKLAEEKKSV